MTCCTATVGESGKNYPVCTSIWSSLQYYPPCNERDRTSSSRAPWVLLLTIWNGVSRSLYWNLYSPSTYTFCAQRQVKCPPPLCSDGFQNDSNIRFLPWLGPFSPFVSPTNRNPSSCSKKKKKTQNPLLCHTSAITHNCPNLIFFFFLLFQAKFETYYSHPKTTYTSKE